MFALLCLPMSWHLTENMNSLYVKEWRYDSYDKDVMGIINENHKSNNANSKRITFSTTKLFKPSSRYYKDLFSMNFLDIETSDEINYTSDYIYCLKKDLSALDSNYTVIIEYIDTETILLRKTNKHL